MINCMRSVGVIFVCNAVLTGSLLGDSALSSSSTKVVANSYGPDGDNFAAGDPQPEVIITNIIRAPAVSSVVDPVTVTATILQSNGATNLSAVVWYRSGTNGNFANSVQMANTSGTSFSTTSAIPSGEAGVMDFYIECGFSDLTSQNVFSVLCPFDGRSAPFRYTNTDSGVMQNFDTWPGDWDWSSYSLDGWTINDAAALSDLEGWPPGQSGSTACWLQDYPATNSYVMTPILTNGCSEFSFWSCVSYGYGQSIALQSSPTGAINWTTLNTFRVTSLVWTNYRSLVAIQAPCYLRIVGTSVGDLVGIDTIRCSLPPASVAITNVLTHPACPSSNQTVNVSCCIYSADGLFPALDVTARMYYKPFHAVSFSGPLAMTNIGNRYYTLESIPAYPENTVIQYYVECTFKGYHSSIYDCMSPAYFPSSQPRSGTNSYFSAPSDYLSYTVRRSISDYTDIKINTDSQLPIRMLQVGDGLWEGVMYITNGALNPSWSLISERPVDATNYSSIATNVWGDSLQTDLVAPYSGKLQPGGSNLTIVAPAAGQYVLRFDESDNSYLVQRCVFQDFDSWFARPQYFEESLGLGEIRLTSETFNSWTTNRPVVRAEDFSSWPVMNFTPDIVQSGSVGWIVSDSAIVGNLYGGASNRCVFTNLQPYGFVRQTEESLLDGVGALEFDYRVGDAIDKTTIFRQATNWLNSTFSAKIWASDMPTNTSRSLFDSSSFEVYARYQNPSNYYSMYARQVQYYGTIQVHVGLYRVRNGIYSEVDADYPVYYITNSAALYNQIFTNAHTYSLTINNYTNDSSFVNFELSCDRVVMARGRDQSSFAITNSGAFGVRPRDIAIVMDDVVIGPSVYQGFRGWPRLVAGCAFTNNYGWFVTNALSIEQDNAGNSDRHYVDLDTNRTGQGLVYIQSPPLSLGAGSINLRYFNKSGGPVSRSRIEWSTNSVDWASAGSFVAPSQDIWFQFYTNLTLPYSNVYVRIVNGTNGTFFNSRLALDDICIRPSAALCYANDFYNDYSAGAVASGWTDMSGHWRVSNNYTYNCSGYAGVPLTITVDTCPAEAEPSYPTNWMVAGTYSNLTNLRYQHIVCQIQKSSSNYVRIKHASGDGYLHLDNLLVSSWRGRDLVTNGWFASDVWVTTNRALTTNCLEFLGSRSLAGNVQGLRSPYMTNGVGVFAFSYMARDATPVTFDLQVTAAGQTNLWETVASITNASQVWQSYAKRFDFSDSRYVRIVHTSPLQSATLLVDDVSITDHPAGISNTWMACNVLITALQTNLLRQSAGNVQGAYLNHNTSSDRLDGPFTDDMPFVQSAYLANGIGEVSFWYRNWGLPYQAGQLLIKVAPSQDTPAAQWKTIAAITNVTAETFARFTTKTYDTSNHFVRIYCDISQPSGRVCLDDVLVTEPLCADLFFTNLFITPALPMGSNSVDVCVAVQNLIMTPKDVVVSAYFATATNYGGWGMYNHLAMSLVSSNAGSFLYKTTIPIPAQPAGTYVSYYVGAAFTGEYSEISSPKYYRPGGRTPFYVVQSVQSEISGVIWNDCDNDGFRDGGESGLDGWNINLVSMSSGQLVATATTAQEGLEHGVFRFEGVSPGAYSVAEVLPSGWSASFPLGGFQNITIPPGGAAITNISFGNWHPLPSEIRGCKWIDSNTNSIKDAGESVVPGWKVYIDRNANGRWDGFEAFALCDFAGNYAFTNLLPGEYLIREESRTNWTQVFPGRGLQLASNGSFEQGGLDHWTATGGARVVTESFGSGPFDGTNEVLLSTAAGSEPVNSLSILAEVAADSLSAVGSGSVTEGAAIRQFLSVQAGAVLSFEWNFLSDESGPYSFDDFAFVSLGSGMIIRLADVGDAVSSSSTPFSHESGFRSFTYQFPTAGVFAVCVGVVDVGDDLVDSALLLDHFSVTGVPGAHFLDLTTNQLVRGIDFGNVNFPPGKICGAVWDDLNGNGIRDVEESGVEGLTVFVDCNGNGLIDGGELSTVTVADGEYSIDNLADGSHRVVAIVTPGWYQTFPAGVRMVDVAPGQTVEGRDFGIAKNCEIRGSKWNDLNGNGVWDAGEPTLSGWTIHLDLNRNGRSDAGDLFAVTDTNGSYTLTNVPLGRYVIEELCQSGWLQTYACTSKVSNGFAFPVNIHTNGSPLSVAASDLDGDGLVDLLVGDPGVASIAVLRNSGNGSFATPVVYPVQGPPVSLIFGDFNSDGYPDIAVAHGLSGVSVLMNNSNGCFRAATCFGTQNSANLIAAADCTGDGRVDIVTCSRTLGQVSVLINNAAGSFQSSMTAVSSGGQIDALAVADFDGDGASELAVCGSGTTRLMENGGISIFSLATTLSLPQVSTTVAACDLNGDGRPDLAVGGTTTSNAVVSIVRNNGSGGFSKVETYDLAESPSSISCGDVDGDGSPDLIVSAGGAIQIFESVNGVQFGESRSYAVGGPCASMIVADFDNDGDQDVFAANGALSLLENTSICKLGMVSGGVYTNINFGNVNACSIQGHAWFDANGDGLHNQGESFVKDRVVYLDQNRNGMRDRDEFVSTTGVDGGYSFENLLPGAWRVCLELPAKWVSTSSSGAFCDLILASGERARSENVEQLNFGSRPLPSQISGTKWIDLDRDGVRDPGDVGIVGWPIYIEMNDGVHSSSNSSIVFSGADGHYCFSNLPAASYRVREGLLPCADPVQTFPPKDTTSYSTGFSYLVGRSPYSITCADYDRDGFMDIATANNLGNNISVLHNSASGLFATGVSYPCGASPVAIASGDLNSDGWPDLVTIDGTANARVFLNYGNGQFPASGRPYSIGAIATSVAVGDINNDSVDEIVVAASYVSYYAYVAVLWNNGQGVFSLSSITNATGAAPMSLILSDVNCDGWLDVVTANSGANTLSVLRNQGEGVFAPRVDYPVGTSPRCVAVGDFNMDGLPDLVAANSGSSTVSIITNLGNGTFSAKTDYGVGVAPYAVAVSDVNGDGYPDVITANNGAASASILVNNGAGAFAAPTTLFAGSLPRSLIVADFNGDLLPEVALPDNNNPSKVTIFTNSTKSGSYAAVLDADQIINGLDFGNFLSNMPPVIVSNLPPEGPFVMGEGTNSLFACYAFDPEGSNIDYTWMLNGLPVGVCSNTHLMSTPWGSAGTNILSVHVSDGRWTNVCATWPVRVLFDNDADGMPNSWEFQYGLDPFANDAALDLDADGMSNISEFHSGTIPSSHASALRFSSFRQGSGPGVVISWLSTTNRVYLLERSSNLFQPFTAWHSNIPATPPVNSFTDSVSGAWNFYRIKLQQRDTP